MAKAKKLPWTLDRTWPWLLTVGGIIGFLASLIITIEKIELIKDPSFVPSCNINPVISCGSVMSTWQASAFGFPNPLIGIASFSLLTTIGVMLLAGAKHAQIKRWFWLGLQFGTIFGVLFVHWLIYQTNYVIGALCPYCMVVWSMTIPIFWYTTLYNFRTGVIATPTKLKGVVAFAQRHHGDILLLWFMAILTVILTRFWYYWKTLI